MQFLEGRLATVVRILLIDGAFLAFWRWSSLSWHARGLILAAYGAVLLLVVLSVLRLRARAQGTVVGVEQRAGRANDRPVTYFHPRVRFTTPAGRTVVFTSAIGSTGQPRVGASLRVRYRLADPEQAEVVSVATWVLGRLQSFSGWGCWWRGSCRTCRSRQPAMAAGCRAEPAASARSCACCRQARIDRKKQFAFGINAAKR